MHFSSVVFCQRGPGAALRSDDLRFPSCDQVHIPQVRSFRNHQPSRFHVRSLAKYYQREDLHFPLVLVYHHGHSPWPPPRLQVILIICSGTTEILIIGFRAVLLAVPRIRPIILHARNRFVSSEVLR